jgi:hypothetical protein
LYFCIFTPYPHSLQSYFYLFLVCSSHQEEAHHKSEVTATNDLTVVGVTRHDVFQGRQASQVTCLDNLTVQGVLECQGNVSSTGQVAAQYMFCNTDITVLGNVYGWTPFWIAGRVLGSQTTPTVVACKGRTGFSVARRSGAAGQFIITFNQNHPDGSDYVICQNHPDAGWCRRAAARGCHRRASRS